ncbi:DHA2 family efflux MFS transporter permease subunit [Rhizobium halophytocola]|uniref:DHA2 family multidrug resistance protein n=1 Tax=Rhizobium halophytocola TaxID=735519 RepID=A0ABS4DVE5_9HYPH|nr:DHA2 family efflux MFS transporter permease subunit [Rhizobium halophytocola]MBP1849658.1 DHA2 family multidrug resistance protein [Rhizobium halophytocola]
MAQQKAAGGWTDARSAAGNRSPWLMTFIISIATFMEILDTSIANVSLSNIAGNLGVSENQATWMVTSYLVANAIVIPISGFLSRAIGRKRYFLFSIFLFTASSFACALSPNLGFLILARVLQGIGGGGLAPVEQSMLTDSFPPEKRGQAFAAFGLVVVVAPIIGPTIGGYITDTISWHWIFLINLPVGILAIFLVQLLVKEPDVLVRERAARLKKGLKVDYVGFILAAVGLAGLLIMLDRGQTEGWFDSTLIRWMTAMAVLGLGGMTIWELNHDDPIVPLKLLKNRNLAISTVMMLLLGVLVFGTIQIIPQMLQQVFGYTAYNAGLVLTYGGAIALLMMPLSGAITGKVDPRLLLIPAFAMQAVAFWSFSGFNLNSTFADAAWGRFFMSIALPFLFIPITTVAYVGLPPDESDKASAMLNFFRNLGGAFGISLTQTLLARRDQFHQSRMTETVNELNPYFQHTLGQMTAELGSKTKALGALYSQIQGQAMMLAYIDVFRVLMWSVAIVIPFILLLRTRGGKAA